MPARDPREAVLEHLAARGARSGLPGWTVPRLDTVEFVKQREVHGHRVYVVECEADNARFGTGPLHVILRAERLGRAWVVRSGGTGVGEGPPRGEPHVDLGGSWGRFGFCGGGKVHPQGADVARVRLRFANGIECEDDTDTGWVLFFDDRPVQRPKATVELLSPEGDVVATSSWPTQRDLAQTLLGRIPRG